MSDAVNRPQLRLKRWDHTPSGKVIIEHNRNIDEFDEEILHVAVKAYVAALRKAQEGNS
jgi:hypothetical protein